jgi:lipoprotein-anchoring transpeptidase ErfK/SrfK
MLGAVALAVTLALAASPAWAASPAGGARTSRIAGSVARWPAAVGPAARSGATKVLSNETTHTTWALANYRGRIYSQPSTRSRVITRLLIGTPDGLGLQTYELLSEQFTKSGTWVRLRVPGRPNGRIGWVERGELEGYQVVHTELIVNRAARLLTLYRNGRAIFHAPVGVGKPSTPTPAGHFWITEAFVSTDPFYGPYAFGTTDYSTLSEWPGGGVVGLHGTNEPQLVPGDPSHGCIRLHNSDILRLKRLLPIGTPIWIQ